ncbi:RNA polymerase sigma factor ShbA [Nocardia sp. CDC159]|uniref:RNA polymerase sigma factor ShbA n=1 Tax=Nocardia pulmonis TaxID=2951408 RepID=A0A9X2E8N0_9NOCA|nr:MULTISPECIES: RNA polymerase sigma factor ShbA [Nocardia]MCM6775671.1 RNA polymerase sigma factor ShbA [Nocardia pulmonis]MCM6788353.1 RNA polymerase sigma factor ShbA [Nocardia sp. CDC159]
MDGSRSTDAVLPVSVRVELETQVDRAVAGDRSAVSRVLEIVRPWVLRYCRARVGAGETARLSADDVAQEVCIAVAEALPRYRQEGKPFMAFVYRVAAHKLGDAFRALRRNRSIPAASVPDSIDTASGPEARALDREAAERMRALIETLPPTQRHIVYLRVVAGLSADEVAARLGTSPGAVRTAQHRALSRLRAELSPRGHCRRPETREPIRARHEI